MGVSNQLREGRGGLRASLRLSLLSTTSNNKNDATTNNQTKEARRSSSSSSSSSSFSGSSPPKLYSLFKTAIAINREQQLQRRQERQQAKQLKLAIETYRRKGRVCLTIAKTAHPKIQDHRGVYRCRKAFTVKPNVDGTFEAPKRLQAKRWKGSLPCIGETTTTPEELPDVCEDDDDDDMVPPLMIQKTAREEDEERVYSEEEEEEEVFYLI